MNHDADQTAPPPSPEDEAAVRRLLADAREGGPLPPAVAARLDRTLAGLSEERSADGSPQVEVVALAPRRRRAAALLVAAAAVVVGGVALASRDSGSDNGSASTAADSSVSRAQGSAAEDYAAAPNSGSGGGGSARHLRKDMDASRSTVDGLEAVVPGRLRPDHLAADLRALRSDWRRVPATAYDATAPVLPPGFPCAPASYGRGVLLGARYGARPAVVAFRMPRGDTQVVEVLQCGTGEVLRSTALPVG